jgi:hypothetical protein
VVPGRKEGLRARGQACEQLTGTDLATNFHPSFSWGSWTEPNSQIIFQNIKKIFDILNFIIEFNSAFFVFRGSPSYNPVPILHRANWIVSSSKPDLFNFIPL